LPEERIEDGVQHGFGDFVAALDRMEHRRSSTSGSTIGTMPYAWQIDA
jgi:hypothetical protein